MTTTLDTSCSENAMVLSARRGFLHACIFKYKVYMIWITDNCAGFEQQLLNS